MRSTASSATSHKPPATPTSAPTRSPAPVRRKPTLPAAPEAESLLARMSRAAAREVNFVITPEGGWTTRRAVGRVVLGLMALSGPAGAVVVASLILLKERHHIARGIRAGIERIHSRSHRGRRVPPSSPPRRVSRPTADPPPPSHTEVGPPTVPSPESPTSAPGGVTAPLEGGRVEPPGAERPPLVEVAARLELTPPPASGTSARFDWQVAQRITVREHEGSVLD